MHTPHEGAEIDRCENRAQMNPMTLGAARIEEIIQLDLRLVD